MSKTELAYWCPTCKKYLIFETELPVICGSPICAKCNGQVWVKTVAEAKAAIEAKNNERQKHKEDMKERWG